MEEQPLVENQCWDEVEQPIGLQSKEPIYCPMCKAREPSIKVEMVMRRSRIHMVADMRIANPVDGNRPYAMDMAYKCPRCDYYCMFGVPTSIEHAQNILKLRDSKVDFILPEDAWKENDKIKKRLAKWGYW